MVLYPFRIHLQEVLYSCSKGFYGLVYKIMLFSI